MWFISAYHSQEHNGLGVQCSDYNDVCIQCSEHTCKMRRESRKMRTNRRDCCSICTQCPAHKGPCVQCEESDNFQSKIALFVLCSDAQRSLVRLPMKTELMFVPRPETEFRIIRVNCWHILGTWNSWNSPKFMKLQFSWNWKLMGLKCNILNKMQ